MADATAVDRLYQEAGAITGILGRAGEYSLEISVADSLRKALLLAAASHFEHSLCGTVLDFVREQANGSVLVSHFAQNKAIARQYHTWFQWDASNANQFFGMFGPEFRGFMQDQVSGSTELRDGIKAFLELGNDRNRLVHQDYATFLMEKTIDEVYEKYLAAKRFVDFMPEAFKRCVMRIMGDRNSGTGTL